MSPDATFPGRYAPIVGEPLVCSRHSYREDFLLDMIVSAHYHWVAPPISLPAIVV